MFRPMDGPCPGAVRSPKLRAVLECSNRAGAITAAGLAFPERQSMSESLVIAYSQDPQFLLSQMANRHGLVAGATGTGKTVTLQVMAEAFSSIGVPVFAADV